MQHFGNICQETMTALRKRASLGDYTARTGDGTAQTAQSLQNAAQAQDSQIAAPAVPTVGANFHELLQTRHLAQPAGLPLPHQEHLGPRVVHQQGQLLALADLGLPTLRDAPGSFAALAPNASGSTVRSGQLGSSPGNEVTPSIPAPVEALDAGGGMLALSALLLALPG